jgi:hypothetical protein
MAAWRREALARFPALRRDIQTPRYSIYLLFFDLLPMVRQAHATADGDTLQQIYGFAAWCLSQPAGELRNAAAVAFYEDMFDSSQSDWPAIAARLSPTVIGACWPLWEARLPPNKLRDLRTLLGMCPQERG